MKQAILIFEDEFVKNLFPLAYTRPVYDLRCGILTIKEKIERDLPDYTIILHARNYLTDVIKAKFPSAYVNEIPDEIDECILINGTIIPEDNIKNLPALNNTEETIYLNNQRVAFARIKEKNIKKLAGLLNSTINFNNFEGITRVKTDVKLALYPWDFVNNNGSQIKLDFLRLVNKGENNIRGEIYEGVHLINKQSIYIGEGSKIKPGVVIDAEEGPVFIDREVTVFPNAVIEGPCYIGRASKIKTGAKIYENTSIGPVCKIGGEVEESIVHSYSNKQHDGFLGHAYLGQWVNLGADTNNSDLKNNYSNVRVFINDEPVDSGSMFVGLTMGDHSKSAINTMFNTGTVVGLCANIFGAGFPEKYIPSFTWGFGSGMSTYRLEKSFEVAAKVMKRRNIDFTEADKKLLSKIFELTSEERKKRNLPE